MNYKIGGLDSIRDVYRIRDVTANVLKEVCNEVEVEAKIILLTSEQLQYNSAITGDEARLDIRAQIFWERDQKGFFRCKCFRSKR